VEVPPVPARDPATAILTDPKVAEDKRFCSNCEHPVGRGRDGTPGRTEGFCSNCGTRFSFSPKLSQGDLVVGQYGVLGCLAHGGLGWIYLARDHNVSDRWVVLKGLLDSGDADATAAAVAERRFLAQVEHPNIVRIYNFVEHPDSVTGEPIGYIVMEYVGGQSLKQIYHGHRGPDGKPAPLPITQAAAYALEILPAMAYLHAHGLIYCDFKPDNVIQTDEQVKLIDMGAVRQADDETSAIYGTVGYQAPEIAADGPSVSSDLYTVGRALAVLTLPFPDYNRSMQHTLPTPADEPLLARYESYYRLLLRATHEDPELRFGSADEMADQLTGVLREVLADTDDTPRPAVSALFAPQPKVFGARTAAAGDDPAPREVAEALPVPLVDVTDPAAAVLAASTASDPATVVAELSVSGQLTRAVRLRLARAYIDMERPQLAAEQLDAVAQDDPYDWQVTWIRGMAGLVAGDWAGAREHFEAVLDALPGEAAPKLAVAACAAATGDEAVAGRWYELVWTTDRAYVSAAYGLVTLHRRGGADEAAVTVLDQVPETSIHYTHARSTAVQLIARDGVLTDVLDAAERLDQLTLDPTTRAQLATDVLQAALRQVLEPAGPPGGTPGPGVGTATGTGSTGSGGVAVATPATQEREPNGSGVGGVVVLGYELTERSLRTGLERAYRSLARSAETADERIWLVDRANMVRPRTLV
jgi:serine/threonine-protein kinase PknG